MEQVLTKTEPELKRAPLKKKVVMVIAFRGFKDQEYFVPKEILEKFGIEVKTASTKLGIAIGAEGGEAKIDFLISNLNVNDFDALIFIGGPKCLDYLDNEDSYNLVKEAKKVLAAICISPVILAKAGVLKGKKATVWSSSMDKSAIKILKEKGADYKEEPVVIDGRIITANGPGAAEEFGYKVIELLTAR